MFSLYASRIEKKVRRSRVYRRLFFPPYRQTPDISGQTMLFVCGLHKSGTSALHRVIRNHPDVSGFRDTGHREDEGQFLQTLYTPDASFGGPGRFAFAQVEDDDHDPTQARATLLREWAPYFENLAAPILVEKSPANILRIKWLQRVFPESVFLVVVRHPIPVSFATKKWSKSSLVELVTHWWVAHERLLGGLRFARKALVIRYEDLVSNPAEGLACLQSLIGVDTPFTATSLSDKNQRYFNDRTARNDPDRALAEKFGHWACESLEVFGYSMEAPFFDANAKRIVVTEGQPVHGD